MSTLIDLRPSLQGKLALVTGGHGGIGRATVEALLAHGVRVAFSIAEGMGQQDDAQRWVAAAPDQLSWHALDLRDSASITACVDAAIARWGRIDILVNNAAVGSATVRAYASDPGAQDSAMLSINADGALKMAQAWLARMNTPQNSAPLKLINLSSVGGGITQFPSFRLSDGMSKAAVAFMTRQLAGELVAAPVDVFAVCPGATNTTMFQSSTLNPMSSDDRAAFVHALPKHRLIEPAEIANLIVFLASEYGAPLHGAVIDASMGLGVRPGLMTERGH